MYFNTNEPTDTTFDAIVVGSGISGGWAAKELTEKGLKVLVLERGRPIKHVVDYKTANLDDYQLPFRGKIPEADIKKHWPVQSRTGYVPHQAHIDFFVKDSEHPYTELKPFDWMRGYHLGGRSITWGRQSYRWSPMDFEANAVDGVGVDWPIRYADLAPWYDYVESYAGISGQAEGMPQLPDGKFQPAWELNCVEQDARGKIKSKMGRVLTPGRTANMTVPHNGRGACQKRNRCMRGCPYGGYFSSLAATLPAAEATGNLTIRTHSIVHSLIYDPKTGKASGVNVIDAVTKKTLEFKSKIVFLCASALGSTFILLNSRSEQHPNGLGSSSEALGRYLMDHHLGCGASGDYEGFDDKYYKGRRPSGFYIMRFRNMGQDKQKDFLRGYGYQGAASREGWGRAIKEMEYGGEYKDLLSTPGQWTMGMGAFGETLPDKNNFVELDFEKKDQWGLPTYKISAEWGDNVTKMREDAVAQAAEMLEAAGAKNIRTFNNKVNPGVGIHEMGTARMGRDRKTSVLNSWNQVWDAPNVFVTDGACMTSAACQNPSLTYMALTARAANHAVELLKKGEL